MIDELKSKIPLDQLQEVKKQEKLVLMATDNVFNRLFKEKTLNQVPPFMQQAMLVQKSKASNTPTTLGYATINLAQN